MADLFTYGSLRCTDIMLQVAGQECPHVPALLRDYFCSRITGETYPGIYPEQGKSVTGVVYTGLGAEAIRRLDNFEGEYYERKALSVKREGHGVIAAYGYVVKPQYRHILTGTPWSFDEFLRHGKQKFIDDYVGFDTI